MKAKRSARRRTVLSRAALIPEAALVVLMATLTLLLLLQITVRTMRVSAPWTVEVIQAVFLWLSLLGAAVAVKTASHVEVDLLSDRLTPRMALVVRLFGLIVTIGVAAILLVEGWQTVIRGTRQTLPITGLPAAWVHSALPVSAALIVLYAAIRVWPTVKAIRSGPVSSAEATDEAEPSIKPGLMPE